MTDLSQTAAHLRALAAEYAERAEATINASDRRVWYRMSAYLDNAARSVDAAAALCSEGFRPPVRLVPSKPASQSEEW